MTTMGVVARSSIHREKTTTGSHAVRAWLVLVALLVIGMVVVGGATRLTDSGLSITEWQPIVGAVPPLSADDWRQAFEKYKAIPEYKEVNAGMTLAEFKVIYWWEWAHRFLGRFIGLVFAVGLVGFWLSGKVRGVLGWKLLAIFALGGLQGFAGWYMVQSGLVDRVDVSPQRLAIHLTLAFVILAAVVWVILELGPTRGDIHMRTLSGLHKFLSGFLVVLFFSQVVIGALVAGSKAGLIYNTWPLMDGRLVPQEFFSLQPWYRNFFEEHGSVQFLHRMLAYFLVLVAIWQAAGVRGDDDESVVRSAMWFCVALIVQAGLGIATLVLTEGEVPIGLGLAHQGWAAIVLVIGIWHLHCVRRAA